MNTELTELLGMPLAYATGINITTTRKRKLRKGVKQKLKMIETEVMSSKEVSQVGAEALMEVMRKIEINE